MEIKRGNDRLVILLPFLKIAIKLPRIYFKEALRRIKNNFTSERGWLKKELFEFDIFVSATFKNFLLKGIAENWFEYRFYIRTKHPFCVPTYFSLLGLLNIQRLVTISQLDSTDFWCQFVDLTNKMVSDKSEHHWTEPENFTLENKRLQILDYGDPKVQEVIKEYGQKILDNFDPNYSWEKQKQELEKEGR